MTRTVPIAALAALLCGGAWPQPAAETPAFEAASVKPSRPPDPTAGYVVSKADGGPGSQDPTRVEFRNYPLTGLVSRAYDLPSWQISAPDWMSAAQFDIDAKVVPGATREQCRLMLQRLLAERFGLRVHRGTKEGTLYSLTIAKGGPKLKAHVEAPPPEDRPGPGDPGQPKFDSGGYPILPRGIGMGVLNGKGRMQMTDTELAPLVQRLANQLDAPVRDDTGLKGKYDIALYWSARPPSAEPEADSGPDLPTAVQEQLGLRLERKKGPVEVLVVNHAEKVPTRN